MGLLASLIILAAIAFAGWLSYMTYLAIGWQWSSLVVFAIFTGTLVIIIAKEEDKR